MDSFTRATCSRYCERKRGKSSNNAKAQRSRRRNLSRREAATDTAIGRRGKSQWAQCHSVEKRADAGSEQRGGNGSRAAELSKEQRNAVAGRVTGMGGVHAEERERAGRPVTSRKAVPRSRCANLICLIPVHCSGRRPYQPMPAPPMSVHACLNPAASPLCP